MGSPFDGTGFGLGDIARLSRAQSRSISAENPTGEKGRGGMATEGTGAYVARELGRGWKVSPSIHVPGAATVTLADIEGPGAIQHIWMTVTPKAWRSLIIRFYWDGEAEPSVEVPVGDLFCSGWCERCRVNSLPISVNPAGGFNSYWPMPFRKGARIMLQNLSSEEVTGFYYQIDCTLTDVPADMAYLHAQWRRSNPLPYKQVHTILDGVLGWGHYVGTYLAWGVHNNGWWGEGEVKFFLDGDAEWPTICGTGTEDYFGGAWDFVEPKTDISPYYERAYDGQRRIADQQYAVFSTPFLGLPQVIKPDGFEVTQQRFGMYRWHIPDPIRFQSDLRVTIQALGWVGSGPSARYLPLQDDIASTAFWYQSEPHAAFPVFPDERQLEVI